MKHVELGRLQSHKVGGNYDTKNMDIISQSEYSEPLAMKQHAARLQKFHSVRTDEKAYSIKSYQTTAPYTDAKSDQESVSIHQESDLDNLVKQQQELLELQSSVQKSLIEIQNKLKRTRESGVKQKQKT